MFEFHNVHLSCVSELTAYMLLSHLLLKTGAPLVSFCPVCPGPVIMLVSVSFLCDMKQNDKQRSDKHIPCRAACNIMIIFPSLFEINYLYLCLNYQLLVQGSVQSGCTNFIIAP